MNTVNQKTIIYATIEKVLKTQVDGAFTNYVIAREETLHHIPDEVSYQSAAMTAPLACAHHGVSKIQVNSGDVAVVMGPGPIGLTVAQVLIKAQLLW